ncbi:hypothetical protein D3C85_1550180 [compost metagenome]
MPERETRGSEISGCRLARLWRALAEVSLAPFTFRVSGETATMVDSVFTTTTELKVLVRSRNWATSCSSPLTSLACSSGASWVAL